ncbi:DUF1588 domain-containing protein [bacterium]|nr:DUF1588 domain-containing protein [bacterium]
MEIPAQSQQQRSFHTMHNRNKSQSVFYRLTVTLIVAITFDATSLFAFDDPASGPKTEAQIVVPEHIQSILATHCLDCHHSDTAEGTVELDQIEKLDAGAKLELLNKAQDQLFFGLMPPKDASQPSTKDHKDLTTWIRSTLRTHNASELDKKLSYPDFGNYVNHQELFNSQAPDAAYAPVRRWLISPRIFEERVVNVFGLEGRDLANARQNGFYGVTNPFVLPEHSGVRDYDLGTLGGGTLLVMLDNAKWIAEKQIVAARIKKGEITPKDFPNPKDRWYPKTTPETFENIILKTSQPTLDEIVAAINTQFERVLQRAPSASELDKYVALTASSIKLAGNVNGLRQMLVSVLLESEFLYRIEFGGGKTDEHGRRKLTPREASFAIAYALGDRGPDETLRDAANAGKLLTKEDYHREVTRLLDDESYFRGAIGHAWGSRDKIPPRLTSHPRIIRFFREFFGYPAALKIFKDLKRSDGFYINPGRGSNQTPGHLVNEADRVVAGIVESDKDVFNTLLTTDKFFLYHNRDNESGKRMIEGWRKAYEALKDTNWKDDPDGVVKAHEELIKTHIDRRGITGRSKARHDNSLIRLMTHFDHTFGKGNQPFTTFPWAHGNHYWHSPIYSLPRMPGRGGYGTQDNFDYQPVQPFPMPGRKGILTHPAWLVAHSGNFQTDPIRRGRWIREKLLAGRVPDVPITVDAQVPEDPHKTFRQRVESVTGQAECWKCHQQMNPLGMPFEGFDDFGRIRSVESLEHPENLVKRNNGNESDTYKTMPVDTSGYLDGTFDHALDGEVTDAFDLIDRLAQSDRVRQSIIRHAFRFFIGRNEMLSDSKTLIDADNAYVNSGGSFRAVIVSLLTSDSFIYRKDSESIVTVQ